MAIMRPIRLALLSALGLATLASSAVSAKDDAQSLPQPLVTLPVDLENNRPTTAFEVHGRTLALLLDTGASKSLLLETEHLNASGLETRDTVDIRFPAFDQTANATELHSVEFRAGDFVFTSHNTLMLHGDQGLVNRLATKMDGILGRDFFRNYAVAISVSSHKMRLYPSGTDLSALYEKQVPITVRGGAPYLVHRSRLPWENMATTKVLMLDTGYPGGVALWDQDQFRRATNPDEAANLRAAGKGILFFGRMRFGALLFNNLPIFIGNHTPKQLQERQGIIGATMLAPFDYAIDLSAGRLWLSPNMAGLYSGFRLDNESVYTPGDEGFVVKDFNPRPSMSPKIVIYGGQAGGQPR